jgi:peptidoglycan/LPS O-acetylase OafA/YrhL
MHRERSFLGTIAGLILSALVTATVAYYLGGLADRMLPDELPDWARPWFAIACVGAVVASWVLCALLERRRRKKLLAYCPGCDREVTSNASGPCPACGGETETVRDDPAS